MMMYNDVYHNHGLIDKGIVTYDIVQVCIMLQWNGSKTRIAQCVLAQILVEYHGVYY